MAEIVYDMPAQDYHALPRLGSSGIADLLISPATFWHRSWMNPDREDEETDARKIGTAYHVARLEPDTFHERYARGFDPSAYPDALQTDSDVQEALADMGEPKTRKGERALDRAYRLKLAGFGGDILSTLRADHEDQTDGRIVLPCEVFDRIAASGDALRRTPEIAALLTGGRAEVSILFEFMGAPCKARIDYLRPDGWADLKTFTNPTRKEIPRAIADAFRYNRNYIQAFFYDAAIRAALGFSEADRFPCHYVFIESNGSPNILAREIVFRTGKPGIDEQDGGASQKADYLMTPSRLALRAGRDIERAILTFKRSLEIHGPEDPWAPLYPVAPLDDDDFPEQWLDGVW